MRRIRVDFFLKRSREMAVTRLRVLGMTVAAAGGAFLAVALNASDAAVERVGEALTGSYANHTLWVIVGGLGAIIAGLCMALPAKRQPPARQGSSVPKG
jgi:formate-dependent nitrite reductase membrane component NrfD